VSCQLDDDELSPRAPSLLIFVKPKPFFLCPNPIRRLFKQDSTAEAQWNSIANDEGLHITYYNYMNIN
jgi:hypothetical protein